MNSKLIVLLAVAPLIASCARGGSANAAADAHADHATETPGPAAQQNSALPADAAGAVARLNASPRHGEYQTVHTSGGDIRVWVSYPQRSSKAPVVIVVHEIFGLTNWVRGVADQLAAEGYIAIAPDLLSGKGVPIDSTGDPVQRIATSAISTLDAATTQKELHDIALWGMAMPSAVKKYGIVGFCWGGGTSFAHAVAAPDLSASVVFYGPTPPDISPIKAPVLGLYGGADARISAAVPKTDSVMKRMGKVYEAHIFDGAGHGFARQQTGQNGANDAAIRQAWPLAIGWFRKYLGK